jgi:hypothetical protein
MIQQVTNGIIKTIKIVNGLVKKRPEKDVGKKIKY